MIVDRTSKSRLRRMDPSSRGRRSHLQVETEEDDAAVEPTQMFEHPQSCPREWSSTRR